LADSAADFTAAGAAAGFSTLVDFVDSLVTGVPVGSFFFGMNQSSKSLDEFRAWHNALP